MALIPLLSQCLSSISSVGSPVVWPMALGLSSSLGLLLAPIGLYICCSHGRSDHEIRSSVSDQLGNEAEIRGGRESDCIKDSNSKTSWSQILALCYSHGVIGWGFFLLNQWLPLYMTSLGISDPLTLGEPR